jgi:Domain of unknown function (DUF4157)
VPAAGHLSGPTPTTPPAPASTASTTSADAASASAPAIGIAPGPPAIGGSPARTSGASPSAVTTAATVAGAGSGGAEPSTTTSAFPVRPPSEAPGAPVAGVTTGGRRARAHRFVAELARHTPDPVVALPPKLAPLARALGGAVPIELRAGPASAAALAAAGRPGATVGRVVHLPRRPDTAPASAAAVAHELVHATRPGVHRQHGPATGAAAPRFFNDDLLDPEEGMARTIGSLVRRMVASDASPMAPSTQPGSLGGAGAPWVPGRGRGEGAGSGPRLRSAPPIGMHRAPVAGSPPNAGPRLGAHRAASAASGGSGATGKTDSARRSDGPAANLERLRRDDPGLAALLERISAARSGLVGQGSTGAPAVAGLLAAAPMFSGSPGILGTSHQLASGGAPPFGALPFGAPSFGGPGGSGAVSPAAGPSMLPVPYDAPVPVTAWAAQLGKKGAPAVEPTPPTVQPSNAPSAEEVLEWIVEHVEQRVLDELERRGRRHVPEVF